MLMARVSSKLSVSIVLIWADVFIIYYLIHVIITKGNFWISFIILVIEITTIIIYRHKFVEKLNSIDHNPRY